MRPRREADHSSPSSDEVKKFLELYLHSPIRLRDVLPQGKLTLPRLYVTKNGLVHEKLIPIQHKTVLWHCYWRAQRNRRVAKCMCSGKECQLLIRGGGRVGNSKCPWQCCQMSRMYGFCLWLWTSNRARDAVTEESFYWNGKILQVLGLCF
jgi:hypothetical protein